MLTKEYLNRRHFCTGSIHARKLTSVYPFTKDSLSNNPFTLRDFSSNVLCKGIKKMNRINKKSFPYAS